MKIDPEFLKFIIVGDIGTGKRTLLSSYGVQQRLSPLYLPIEVNEIRVKGQEKRWKVLCNDSLLLEEDIPVKDDKLARKLLSTAMNGAHAVFLCYSRDNFDSFINLHRWYKAVSLYFSNTTLVYLVETKNDKINNIKEKDIATFAKNNGIAKQFKTRKDDAVGIQNMFTQVVLDVEKAIAELNLQLSSPRKINTSGNLSSGRGGNKSSVVYNDKNEKIVLMDGSYIKMPNVMAETKEEHEARKLGTKNLVDDFVDLEDIEFKKA